MRSWLLLALTIGASWPAAANPQDIEDGEPVTLEDAFTDPPGQLSLQFSGVYAHFHDDGHARDAVEQGPTFKLGAARGIQVSLNPNYDTGSAPGRNAGFVLSDILVQLNTQTRLWPAFAVDVFYSLPFGAGRKSAGTVLRAIATKFLGPSEDSPRLHLNLTDYRVALPESGSRKDQLQLAAGGSVLLTKQDALVADIVTGGAERAGQTETFIEIGYSRDLPEDWTFQVGLGRQITGAANGVRVFFAIEKELQLF